MPNRTIHPREVNSMCCIPTARIWKFKSAAGWGISLVPTNRRGNPYSARPRRFMMRPVGIPTQIVFERAQLE